LEPRLLIVTDPRTDQQAIKEAWQMEQHEAAIPRDIPWFD
jgi:ribosomal protein S2